VVALKVEDVAPNGNTVERATVRQKRPDGQSSSNSPSRHGKRSEDYLRASGKKAGEFLFSGRRHGDYCMTTRQYARLVAEWIGSIGLDPRLFGKHSLRRTKATLIHRRTGNLRAVQLLLGRATYCPRTTG
jgi:integrase